VKTWHLLIALQIIAAAIGLFGLASFYGKHLLDPAVPEAATIALRASFIFIMVSTLFVIGALLWNREFAADAVVVAVLVAMAATALAGYAPLLVDENARLRSQRETASEYRNREDEYLAELARRKREIESHLRDHEPLTSDEAIELLMFFTQGDFRNFGLADHTPANLMLLRQALAEKIIDPNGAVGGEKFFGSAASAAEVNALAERLAALERQPRALIAEINTLKTQLQILSHSHNQFEALRGKPLFLFYYEVALLGDSIEYHFESGMTHEWEIVDLLVQHGADLARSDAAPLVADLAIWKLRAAQATGRPQ
jgi:hypothetical protein